MRNVELIQRFHKRSKPHLVCLVHLRHHPVQIKTRVCSQGSDCFEAKLETWNVDLRVEVV